MVCQNRIEKHLSLFIRPEVGGDGKVSPSRKNPKGQILIEFLL